MDKQKLILPVSILLGCVILSMVYMNYEINKQNSKNRQDVLDAKKRLIELTVTREKYFWDCFSDKVNELKGTWMQSDEYKKSLLEKKPCAPKKQDGLDWEFMRCNTWQPEIPWQEHNEMASKFCSEKADGTQAGQLIGEFRKKVPIEILTDDELRNIADENKWR